MELDHVLVAVADLATAAREIEEQYGLVLLEGGRHPGWGTANRIVPLGESYVELVAVVDPAEAAESAFGRWVSEAQPQLAQPLGWAVRTHELDHVAKDNLAQRSREDDARNGGLAFVHDDRESMAAEPLGKAIGVAMDVARS